MTLQRHFEEILENLPQISDQDIANINNHIINIKINAYTKYELKKAIQSIKMEKHVYLTKYLLKYRK